MKQKRCTKCNRRRYVECFGKWRHGKDGLYPSCKDCVRQRMGHVKRVPREKVVNGTIRRRCSRCKKYKPRGAFYLGTCYRKGICESCKFCCRRESNTELAKLGHRNKAQRVRMEVLSAYCDGKPPKCNCCGETTYQFLCLDHINGGGNKQRKVVGHHFFHWIRKQGFPRGYQVLCHNCNMAKGFYKVCPHKTR